MQSKYFQQLTRDLQQQGTGTPQLILDLAQYQQNLEIVQAKNPCAAQAASGGEVSSQYPATQTGQ